MVELHPVTTLLHEMRHDEYQDLVASIRENGLREPIIVGPDGRVIDGRNRLRACPESGSKACIATSVAASRTRDCPTWRSRCTDRLRSGAPSLMAKLTFCGSLPVRRAILIASSLDTTTPTTLPLASSTGPPLLPG